jgi:hypothetical protein
VNIDEFVKSLGTQFGVLPAKAGIHLIQNVLDPGACPGHDPGFAGVTTKKNF